MNPTVSPAGPPIHFLNVGYFFQLIYNLIIGFSGGTTSAPGSTSTGFGSGFATSLSNFTNTASNIWLFISLLSYLLAILLIGGIVYYTARLHQVEEEEKAKFTTLTPDPDHAALEHSRWNYIRGLIESPQESDWRAAIIEADIMLDELLNKLGYVGDTIGDKLKGATVTNFSTLSDAWEAHKVRNDIAHEGSTYQLSPNVAYRTIGRYENVFQEFNEI